MLKYAFLGGHLEFLINMITLKKLVKDPHLYLEIIKGYTTTTTIIFMLFCTSVPRVFKFQEVQSNRTKVIVKKNHGVCTRKTNNTTHQYHNITANKKI